MWSIGISSGESPFELRPLAEACNPVPTRHDVSDVPAAFVADPFMISSAGVWHMFFEVMNDLTHKGEIALATSADCVHGEYQQVVLSEEFHLSYPCKFQWRGAYYMVRETLQPGGVSLYRAENFPTRWSYVGPSIRVFVLCVFAIAVCALAAAQQSDPSVEQFWAKFKGAVEKTDKPSVASMSQFPIEMPYGVPKIRTRTQLARRWRDLFNVQANAVKCFEDAKPVIDSTDTKLFTVGCKDEAGNEVVVYGFKRGRAGWKLIFLDNINE